MRIHPYWLLYFVFMLACAAAGVGYGRWRSGRWPFERRSAVPAVGAAALPAPRAEVR